MENIVYFNKDLKDLDEKTKKRLGIRGRRAVELAMMGLPIAPGFIIDSELTRKLPQVNLKEFLKTHIDHLEKETKKGYGDSKKPLLLKVVLSSDFNVPYFPSIHNIGLNDKTVTGFGQFTGLDFAYGEYSFLLRSMGTKIYSLEAADFDKMDVKGGKQKAEDIKKAVDNFKKYLGDKFSEDVYDQLSLILKGAASRYCDSEIDVDNSLSIMVQAMVYGNFGNNSYSGNYYTRNIITGDPVIQGNFLQNAFDIDKSKPKDITKIDKKYFDKFSDIAKKVEEQFKEIREIKFTIEEGDFWLVEQRDVDEKSTQAHIKTLLDLCKRKSVSEEYVVSNIKPAQLNELLHPVIDPRTIGGVKTIKGGISGSTGAAIGRVFFSTPKLLEEYKKAIMHGGDTNMILVMPASYAEDVKAIEVARGVITSEGGFSSHAPVVARSLGKVAMVQPEMKIRGTTFTLAGKTVKEGDYVSINVPYYEPPTIYLDKVGLIEPNVKENGLIDFLQLVENFIDDFDVRANADQGRDAKLAREFNAAGIGLCRTEHMFFNEKRIMKFREMILAESEEERRKTLEALKPMQRSDYYELFKTMVGYPVTIRLLDAPLHEFLPRTDESMKEFIKYMQGRKKGVKPAEIVARCEELSEMNPMLGHRGCRVAITYPEIYEMQCRAIFEAACMLRKEGIKVEPEIMIPIVMTEHELKFIKNGKRIEGKVVKGIRDIKDEVVQEYGVDDLIYSVGTMIELPAAALGSGSIAQYAEFFSFGTNDLTQTTYGLSRDDINSFFPSYSLYDLIRNNPFQVLGEQVKELIEVAALRGRLTRPDIKMGLCGEHGADPENIEFCINVGLNYVSCSPYSIPLAKLAVAQYNLKQEE
ncbi:MAG TPA: PEP-utilizing enzyme [Spirochaetota bacterium]|nr:PEP-utilizing enzyme [Spirochaetota bacterium]OPZ39421.1 MAG: Pyruvate, phosphate dikinase [Spirochaetes bacterium ADurb.BinA120]HNU90511.1 PEP-utilizing enzyme [Spirochaetota bacterium]HPI15643.1 PEP-utilizing enzyme [Spirochaetota bacterium]HPO45739.1 PEP-utilizing enzyme [Spirochaetota bacterium]